MKVRSGKKGLDYFPLDVDIFEDDKIAFVSAKYGLKGEAIIIRLLCKIYRNGYYIDWDDDIALLFAKWMGSIDQISLIEKVVNELLLRKFFDPEIFEKYKVLTSKGIQNRYIDASQRRLNVQLNPDYSLLETPNYKENQGLTKSVDILTQNDDILTQSSDILTQSSDIEKQSKVKYSKVKESKRKESSSSIEENTNTTPTLNEILNYFKENNFQNASEEAVRFFHYNESRGWILSGKSVVNWKSLANNWNTRTPDYAKSTTLSNGYSKMSVEELESEYERIYLSDPMKAFDISKKIAKMKVT